jgi:hypothetical protein
MFSLIRPPCIKVEIKSMSITLFLTHVSSRYLQVSPFRCWTCQWVSALRLTMAMFGDISHTLRLSPAHRRQQATSVAVNQDDGELQVSSLIISLRCWVSLTRFYVAVLVGSRRDHHGRWPGSNGPNEGRQHDRPSWGYRPHVSHRVSQRRASVSDYTHQRDRYSHFFVFQFLKASWISFRVWRPCTRLLSVSLARPLGMHRIRIFGFEWIWIRVGSDSRRFELDRFGFGWIRFI